MAAHSARRAPRTQLKLLPRLLSALLVSSFLAWSFVPAPAQPLYVQAARTRSGLAVGTSSPPPRGEGRLTARRYWNTPGPQPEKTTEGTVIPGLIMAVLAGGMAMWPFWFGVSLQYIGGLGVLCFGVMAANAAALAANKNLPVYIDELVAKSKEGK